MTVQLWVHVEAGGRVVTAVVAPGPLTLVFDVETNGGSPQRCIELAFVVLDAVGREVDAFQAYWYLPPGVCISPGAARVHGIDDNKLKCEGVASGPGLARFFAWVDAVRAHPAGRVVAHNAAFDAPVVTREAAALGWARALDKADCLCTMRASMAHEHWADAAGRPKPPKNAELYARLHGAPPHWAKLHAALDDVRITACNFRQGRARGWW
tara:strand:- start:1803 stop:2435 length:633 start_codon:yes stop_codon:yes gene_type:complete